LRAARHAGWQQVEADLLRMDAFLESQVGLQVPSFRDVLELVKKCRQSEQLAGPAEAEPSSPPGLNAAADAVRPTALTSRDQAYDQLHQIALLLARIEPHSPVPSVLQALVQWRHARFEELLERLPQDGPSVYELLRLFKSAPAR
jgi:predicted component of type VI protein secretion system